jgi:TRAP-type C4-dicarboxylate transport system permease small subunit
MIAAVRNILTRVLETLLTVVMTVLVLDVVWQVFSRYVLKDPSSWTEELATFLMIWVALLGACVALNRGAHLGIDYFVSKFSARKRLYTELFVFACIAAFSASVMLLGGIRLARLTFRLGQVSPAMGLKMGYVYLAVPISGFFLVLYSVELMIDRIIALLRHENVESPHDIEAAEGAD